MNRLKWLLMLSLALVTALALSVGTAPIDAVGKLNNANDELCADCHEELVNGFYADVHSRIKAFEVPGDTVGCQSCHGDTTQHVEEGDPSTLVSFSALDAEEASKQCLSCHKNADMAYWHGSAHSTNDVGCTSCHSIHGTHVTASAHSTTLCYTCHNDVQGEMMLPSHHPVEEGKMGCDDCHNPHGSAADSMIKSDERLNDLCFTCHTAKQGPFVFEHAPVVEDCGICHTPHGSVANNLLTENEPYLCLQCHEFHFHTGAVGMSESVVVQRGDGIPNPHGKSAWKMAFATKCTQCHPAIHGSDLPSQGVSSQGQSLTR